MFFNEEKIVKFDLISIFINFFALIKRVISIIINYLPLISILTITNLKLFGKEVLIIVICVILTLIIIGFALYIKNFGLEVLTDRIRLSKGILETNFSIIHQKKYQDLVITQGILERIFNRYTIKCSTSGTSSYEINITGMKLSVKDELIKVLDYKKEKKEYIGQFNFLDYLSLFNLFSIKSILFSLSILLISFNTINWYTNGLVLNKISDHYNNKYTEIVYADSVKNVKITGVLVKHNKKDICDNGYENDYCEHYLKLLKSIKEVNFDNLKINDNFIKELRENFKKGDLHFYYINLSDKWIVELDAFIIDIYYNKNLKNNNIFNNKKTKEEDTLEKIVKKHNLSKNEFLKNYVYYLKLENNEFLSSTKNFIDKIKLENNNKRFDRHEIKEKITISKEYEEQINNNINKNFNDFHILKRIVINAFSLSVFGFVDPLFISLILSFLMFNFIYNLILNLDSKFYMKKNVLIIEKNFLSSKTDHINFSKIKELTFYKTKLKSFYVLYFSYTNSILPIKQILPERILEYVIKKKYTTNLSGINKTEFYKKLNIVTKLKEFIILSKNIFHLMCIMIIIVLGIFSIEAINVIEVNDGFYIFIVTFFLSYYIFIPIINSKKILYVEYGLKLMGVKIILYYKNKMTKKYKIIEYKGISSFVIGRNVVLDLFNIAKLSLFLENGGVMVYYIPLSKEKKINNILKKKIEKYNEK